MAEESSQISPNLRMAKKTSSIDGMAEGSGGELSRRPTSGLFWRRKVTYPASKGRKSNGLNNALDGREDPLMSRDVLETWVDVGGHEMRASIKEEIREKVQSGEYRWCWETIQELVGRDVAERHLGAFSQEGRELEAAQQEGGRCEEGRGGGRRGRVLGGIPALPGRG